MKDIDMNAHKLALISSPIVPDGEVIEEQKISIKDLHSKYKLLFDIDIDYLLPDSGEWITRYKCKESGYRFYKPDSIVGDSGFYKKLQENEWYYMPDKWEFAEALQHISAEEKINVLEIGSAKGGFLELLRQHNPSASTTGLELNRDAAEQAKAKGFDVRVELTSEHARENQGKYDVIASFQVLEHISKPMDVLHDAIAMLKPKGKLIIGVPDNSHRASGSIFVKEDSILNMPPHHQGLWDITSLAFLSKILPLRLDSIVVEPAIFAHHSNAYRGLMKRDLLEKFGSLFGIIIYAAARPFYNHALKHLNKYLPAHTVVAVYSKSAPLSANFH